MFLFLQFSASLAVILLSGLEVPTFRWTEIQDFEATMLILWIIISYMMAVILVEIDKNILPRDDGFNCSKLQSREGGGGLQNVTTQVQLFTNLLIFVKCNLTGSVIYNRFNFLKNINIQVHLFTSLLICLQNINTWVHLFTIFLAKY